MRRGLGAFFVPLAQLKTLCRILFTLYGPDSGHRSPSALCTRIVYHLHRLLRLDKLTLGTKSIISVDHDRATTLCIPSAVALAHTLQIRRRDTGISDTGI